MIKMFCFKNSRNFGDIFTEALLNKFEVAFEKCHRENIEESQLFGCGSILDLVPDGFTGDILGSGLKYKESEKDLSKANVLALRGKLTRERCILRNNVLLGDVGLLSHLFVRSRDKKFVLGIVPHFQDKDRWQVKEWIGRKFVKIIDIEAGVEQVVNDIASCEMVVSSALHGLIVADSIGIPNRWVILDKKMDRFKFYDYYSVFGLKPKPDEEINYFNPSSYNRRGIADIKAQWEILIKKYADRLKSA